MVGQGQALRGEGGRGREGRGAGQAGARLRRGMAHSVHSVIQRQRCSGADSVCLCAAPAYHLPHAPHLEDDRTIQTSAGAPLTHLAHDAHLENNLHGARQLAPRHPPAVHLPEEDSEGVDVHLWSVGQEWGHTEGGRVSR